MTIRTTTSRPLPPSLTDSIPSEIYDHILSHLLNDRLSLTSCCLVCKAWLPLSRRWLFSASKVTVLRANVKAFLELIDRREETLLSYPTSKILAWNKVVLTASDYPSGELMRVTRISSSTIFFTNSMDWFPSSHCVWGGFVPI
ncbi:hypothetical protein K435DRAFT_277387 [Dendrothele bispora CBS 962.96]|uniref:Uncharacterized protein n=1 Tax=Dendrothele bispora (strain CBS 962.96) TaxID=1314807 RepID=A0A4S8LLN8_DENBC|nr:hypothetical protein K435DRAFT_277387 [Dendrothele bispora CBS 962.96]